MTAARSANSQADIRGVEREIDRRLPDIARDVIRAHLDVEGADTRDFLAHPDAREQHQTQWHQWGIITHTRMFLRHLEADVPRYLKEWGLWDRVNAVLSRRIDGISRWDLLRIAILLHDVGKFAARFRGRSRFHFTNHERLSGEIIRRELDLAGLGLTPAQVEYVAHAAEDHFVLGLVRKRARERGEYDANFIDSDEFDRLALAIKSEHPDDYVEIGVLFLGDSLAKVDPRTGPEAAVSQYGVNIEVAHRYLTVVLEGQNYNEPDC